MLCCGWSAPAPRGEICQTSLANGIQAFPPMGKKAVWKRLFAELGEDPDLEYLNIDSTIVRAHQHAAGAKKGGAKMRRSGVRAAGSAPRSTSASMPSAIPS